MEKVNWERLSAILVSLVLCGALVYLTFRYVAVLLLPFLLAWLVALPVRPLAKRIAARVRLPQKLCAVLLLLLVFGLGAWGLVAATIRLLGEAGALIDRLLSKGGIFDSMEALMLWVEGFLGRFGFLSMEGEELRTRLYEAAVGMIGNLLSSIASRLPEIAASLFSALPSAFFFLAVSVIACFYFCMDGERITAALCALLPKGVQKRIPEYKRGWRETVRKYVKAYAILLSVTFFLLLVGFLVLGVEYAFLLALLIAVVDLLPVLGVGTVMIPWGIVMLLQREFYLGFGLLILYLVIELIRQIAEPKLVGKSLGLHPLLTLFATYVGFLLFGLLGMLLAPPVAMLVKRVAFRGRKGEVQKKP